MMLDPQARQVLDAINSGPPLNELGLEEARRLMAARPRITVTAVRQVTDLKTVHGVPVRLYRPRVREILPVIVFVHGGGWILGSVEGSDETCRRLAVASDCAVVSVEYRLAPEARHPAAVTDVLEVLQWLPTMAAGEALDTSRICVAGESSGAHIALCAALSADPSVKQNLRSLLLACPPIDRLLSTRSWATLGSECLPRRSQMAWMWDLYLGKHDEYLSGHPDPARADLAGLPPSVIVVAEYDPLRDEGLDLARRMKESGVAVQIIDCSGQIHPVFGHAPVIHACADYLKQAAEAAGRLIKQ